MGSLLKHAQGTLLSNRTWIVPPPCVCALIMEAVLGNQGDFICFELWNSVK